MQVSKVFAHSFNKIKRYENVFINLYNKRKYIFKSFKAIEG